MNRYAIFCPACGEVGVTESVPPGDGDAACLYCGAAARWWPVDESGEFLAGGSATPAPEFVKSMVRQMSATLSRG